MKRIHLFEFEDLTWFPQFLRNFVTDFLQYVSNKFDIYEPTVLLINRGLEKSETNTIIDIASGGGGGWLSLSKHLFAENKDLNIVLTDYFPNISAFKQTIEIGGNNFKFIEESVDACNLPAKLKGLRTQFLSFHHFPPEKAEMILQNAVDNNSPIAIFEAQERSFVCFAAMLISPLNVLFSTFFIRPFSFLRFIFTYLIPIIPFVVLWDGIVSMLRTYSIKEMNQFIGNVKNSNNFDWEVDRIMNRGLPILYLLGYPKSSK
jgi:hypothetical protein